jgi:hypothetical protein
MRTALLPLLLICDVSSQNPHTWPNHHANAHANTGMNGQRGNALTTPSMKKRNNPKLPHPELENPEEITKDHKSEPPPSNNQHTHPDLDPFEGAKLVKGTFRIFEKAAKLTADALRIAGDTTAGVGGSGIKVVGTAVKTVGSMLETSAETAMEKEVRRRCDAMRCDAMRCDASRREV